MSKRAISPDLIPITPEQYVALYHKDGKACPLTLKQLRRMAARHGDCENCGQPRWRLADTGLCFTCTTGESDGSSDYELVEASGA